MEVFRISREEYSHTLKASGAAGRWNQKGEMVLYTGSSRSLSTLELVVHRGSVIPSFTYKLIIISIADEDHLFQQVQIQDLPTNWRSLVAYPSLQKIGSQWYKAQESLVLKVPSSVIPQEYNFLINTEHPDFLNKVILVRTEPYFWDTRLY